MPEVTEGQVVQVEKLKKRGPRGELVDVDKNDVIYNSLTAAQLEEISNQAYEDVREQARADGFSKGQTEGYQAGVEAAREELAQGAKNLSSTIDMLYSALAGQDDDVEQALVKLVICVSRSILRRELSVDSSHIADIVRQAMETLPLNARDIVVHLSEQDYHFLEQHQAIASDWQLQIDRTLTAGGCRITSKHSVVEYTLEDQFQQTINALVEQRFAALADSNSKLPVPENQSHSETADQ